MERGGTSPRIHHYYIAREYTHEYLQKRGYAGHGTGCKRAPAPLCNSIKNLFS